MTDSCAVQGRYNFEIEDYSASAAQMLLAAAALGYVSLWLDSPYFEEDKQKAALAALGAPNFSPCFKAMETAGLSRQAGDSRSSGCSLRVVLPIGFPESEGERRSKMAFEERVSYRKYGKQEAQ